MIANRCSCGVVQGPAPFPLMNFSPVQPARQRQRPVSGSQPSALTQSHLSLQSRPKEASCSRNTHGGGSCSVRPADWLGRWAGPLLLPQTNAGSSSLWYSQDTRLRSTRPASPPSRCRCRWPGHRRRRWRTDTSGCSRGPRFRWSRGWSSPRPANLEPDADPESEPPPASHAHVHARRAQLWRSGWLLTAYKATISSQRKPEHHRAALTEEGITAATRAATISNFFLFYILLPA